MLPTIYTGTPCVSDRKREQHAHTEGERLYRASTAASLRALHTMVLCFCFSYFFFFICFNGSLWAVAGVSAEALSSSSSSSSASVVSFVFGDSLVDAGNNNYLRLSSATAKDLPNGIDFPTINAKHPTGRFSNGLTIPDILGLKLGSKSFTPPFLAPTSSSLAILNGVNYASGGAGILNDTGRLFVQRIPMDAQLGSFEQRTVPELKRMLGDEKAQELLAKAIFSVTIGANDLLSNYLSFIPLTKDKFLPWETFSQNMLSAIRSQLMRLYDAGARKVVVVNIPLVGCSPYLRSLRLETNGSCAPIANARAASYNILLKGLLEQLNANLPDAHFLYADAYGITLRIVNNPQAYGFENVAKACCGALGLDRGVIPCRSYTPVCPDRSRFFFWDPYHPTQAGYEVIANEFWQGSQYISPINVQQLAAL